VQIHSAENGYPSQRRPIGTSVRIAGEHPISCSLQAKSFAEAIISRLDSVGAPSPLADKPCLWRLFECARPGVRAGFGGWCLTKSIEVRVAFERIVRGRATRKSTRLTDSERSAWRVGIGIRRRSDPASRIGRESRLTGTSAIASWTSVSDSNCEPYQG
jgi:hypothetical protein